VEQRQCLDDNAAWEVHGLRASGVSPCIYTQASFSVKLIQTKKPW
jgi:hypothetical protein